MAKSERLVKAEHPWMHSYGRSEDLALLFMRAEKMGSILEKQQYSQHFG